MSTMNVRRRNRAIFSFPEVHPARVFLEAFIECRRNCVGREIEFKGSSRKPVDQIWVSATDGKQWKFSSFAYIYLSFDLVLDGWLSDSPTLTDSERGYLHQLPLLRTLMHECRAAAVKDKNETAQQFTEQVLETLFLWERCILDRPRSNEKNLKN